MKITTKQKKLLVSSLVALILALTGVLLSWLGGEETYTPVYINGSYEVERVIDGDTIVITYQDIEETVRFIGVDAPEVNRIPEHTTCGARMAKEFVESKVLGQTVELKADPSQGDRDKYGRLLAYVFLEDGTDLGKSLYNEGSQMNTLTIQTSVDTLLVTNI